MDIAKFITGEMTAPLPTYFLGGADKDGLLSVMGDMQELCPNITYLGKHGVTTLHGLKVGFVSGLFSDATEEQIAAAHVPSTDAEKDAAERKRLLVTDMANIANGVHTTSEEPADFHGVDALFTNQWSRGITVGAAADALPAGGAPSAASGTITVAAAMLRPRYHFCGAEEVSWARAPYRSNAASVSYTMRLHIKSVIENPGMADIYIPFE